MAGALRKVGKFLQGVSQVAVPMALEQHRANILAKRDAVLNSYSQSAQASQQRHQAALQESAQAHDTNENRLTREQRDRENAQQVALQAGGLANDTERLNLSRQQAAAAIKQIDQQLELGEISLDAAKQLKEARQSLVNAKTPEEMDAAYDLYTRLTGDAQTDRYQATTIYGEENEMGQQTRATGVLNTRTGEMTPASMGGASAEGNDPLGIRSLFQQTSPAAAASQSASSSPPATGGAIARATQATSSEMPDVLDGYNLDPEEGAGSRLLRSMGESISASRRERNAEAQNWQLDQVVPEIKSIIASRNLAELGRLRALGALDAALNSNRLADNEKAVIRAWLDRQ